MKRKLFPFLLILFGLLLIAAVLFINQIYKINRRPPITKEHKRVLINLAHEATKIGELPIASVLLHDYTIVGEGINSVVHDSDLTGHAEINAIKDAIKNIGYENFMKSDKDDFTLISTYDPCEMCKGVLQHYGIYDIQFIREGSATASISENFKELLYQIKKKQLDTEDFLKAVE